MSNAELIGQDPGLVSESVFLHRLSALELSGQNIFDGSVL